MWTAALLPLCGISARVHDRSAGGTLRAAAKQISDISIIDYVYEEDPYLV
jgi:hypothetical protein